MIANPTTVRNPIDLTKLPFPGIIETLDYELIVAQSLAALRALDPVFTATVESDPAYKIIEVFAYREMTLRQRINDAARAVMLPYAIASDLDNLAALVGVERLEDEDDARLRSRTQLALEGFTTAGPVGAYVFHALSASTAVKDIDVSSPSPGDVVITVLSTEGDGTPDQGLLDAVTLALTDESVRPLTDHVTVAAPVIIPYAIDATLYMYEGPDAESVRAVAEQRLQTYVNDHHRLGHDIAMSGLHAALHVEGAVQRVELATPTTTLVIAPGEAAYNTTLSVVVGGRDE